MNVSELLGQLAAVLALTCMIPYVRSILQGKTKPNRASWFIWLIVNCSLVFSYHSSGATTTIWLNIAYIFTTLTIFLLSLKYGTGGYTRLDITCLLGAAAGLVLWWLTDNAVIALYMNVFVDLLGFLPTLKKAYLQPRSENSTAWDMSTVANALNVAALTTWQFKIIVFPIYNFTFNALTAILLYGIIQKKFAIKVRP
jgi:hypothetical protein